jgi:hypothetical protein
MGILCTGTVLFGYQGAKQYGLPSAMVNQLILHLSSATC